MTVWAWGKLRRETHVFGSRCEDRATNFYQRGKYKMLGLIMANKRNVIAWDVQEVR